MRQYSTLAKGQPPVPSLFLRMAVSRIALVVSFFTMFVSRRRMLLRLVVVPLMVMMGRLVVVMRSGVVVSSRLGVMILRRMLSWMSHLIPPYNYRLCIWVVGTEMQGLGSRLRQVVISCEAAYSRTLR